MLLQKLWRNRRPWLRGGLFLLAIGAVAVGMYVMVPPEPRWVRADGPRAVFDAGNGRIATYRLATGAASGPVQLLDAATGDEIGRFLTGAEKFQAHGQADDGRTFVALVKDDRPDTWRLCGVDLHERREWQVDVQVGPFESARFSPRCDFVALRRPGLNDTEKVYVVVETASGRVVARITLPRAAEQTAFSGDGGCLVLTYQDEDGTNHIRVTSTRTGKTTTLDDTGFVAISPDARWLIGDRGDDGVWLWDVAGSWWHCQLAETKRQPVPQGAELWTELVLRQRHATIRAFYTTLRTSRRGRHARWHSYAFLGDWRNSGDGQMFSPDSRLVVCTSSPESGPPQLTLYDAATGKPLWKRTWRANSGEPRFTPDSRWIVMCGDPVEVLNAANGATERTMPLVVAEGESVQLTRDGRTLVVGATPAESEPHWLWAKFEEWFAPAPPESVADRDPCFRPGNRRGPGRGACRGSGRALADRGPAEPGDGLLRK